MADIKKADHGNEHPTFSASTAEGRMRWFFHEFWPIIIPASFFLLMCAFPLTVSGMLHNPFSSSDVVWGGYGLLLIAEFIFAVILVCLAPSFLGIYMLLLGIYSLIAAEQGHAWTVGFLNDGMHHTWMINTVAILFLTYVLIGNLVFMRASILAKKSRL